MNRYLLAMVSVLLLLSLAGQASGAIIPHEKISIGPGSLGYVGSTYHRYETNNLVNGSGMVDGSASAHYDFDATHIGTFYAYGDTFWVSANGAPTGAIFFNLGEPDGGGVWTVDKVAFWNIAGTSAGVEDFQLGYSTSSSASWSAYTDLGLTPSTLSQSDSEQTSAQIFEFAPVSARYFALNITSNHGDGPNTTLGEIAFNAYEAGGGGGEIPEPTTFAIWGTLGGLGLIAAARRRRRK